MSVFARELGNQIPDSIIKPECCANSSSARSTKSTGGDKKKVKNTPTEMLKPNDIVYVGTTTFQPEFVFWQVIIIYFYYIAAFVLIILSSVNGFI